jgi:hypothetical protein
LSFDQFGLKGLFRTAEGVGYGYRLDTLTTWVDYRMSQYNPNSPDTLRFYISYHNFYNGNISGILYGSFTNGGYWLTPYINYATPFQTEGPYATIPSASDNSTITRDYILSDNDSVNAGRDKIAWKMINLPINTYTMNGFTVPAGACLSVVVKYIPGYTYNNNDTISVITWNTDIPAGAGAGQYVSGSIQHNSFSIANWNYDTATRNYMFDHMGYNGSLHEPQDIRYKDTISWGYSTYHPGYYGKPVFYMGLSISDDTAYIVAPGKYHVSVSANNASMGLVTGDGDYEKNNTAIITATPYSGYRFVHWSDGNIQNPRTITVTQDTSFVAIFAMDVPGMYHISVTTNNPSMGIVTGDGDYSANYTATITAIANQGYYFVGWNDGNTTNPRTITVIQDRFFMATFASSTPSSYQITVLANDNTKGTVTGSGDYAANSTVSIAAIPYTGYRFAQWSDGNTQNPRTIMITQNITLTAIFVTNDVPGIYHVSVVANNLNMGIVSGNGDYTANTTVTITAIPTQGYRFVQWSDGNTQNPRIITVTQDITLVAIFAMDVPGMYHVSVTANNPNMGSVYESGDYIANNTINIVAVANPGYRFVGWYDGNTQNPRVITVTQDTSFIAIFVTQGMYHVSVTANNPSMGIVTGGRDYYANSTATITATANQGYYFVGWNDGNTQNSRDIIVTQDMTFMAIFAASTPSTYRITVLANDATRGTVTGSGDFAANSRVPIAAIPNKGYYFVLWDDGNNQSTREITVTKNQVFTAIFEKITSITDIDASSAINIYPNPTTDNITVVLPENVHQALFTLYDIQGKVLIRKDINNQDAIQVSNLAAGIYIYNVRTEKQNYHGKLKITK